MYNMASGTTTAMNNGVATEMTRTTPIADNTLYKNDWTVAGMSTSVTKISRENLFKTRPIGVVSKNDIGHRRMFLSSLLCNVLEANTLATVRETVLASVNTDWMPPRPA